MTTHSIRILSVGIYGLPSGENRDFEYANVLQDYDAVVVNPNRIETLFNDRRIKYRNAGRFILDSENAQFLLNQSHKRRREIQGLLEKGGIVIVFMQPILRYPYGEDHNITNYDWLIDRSSMSRELGISFGKGDTVDELLVHHPFYEYLKLKPDWNAYADITTATQYDWQILASAFNTHSLSLIKQVNNGQIIFIPSTYSSDNGSILEDCIQSVLRADIPSPKPDWLNDIVVPGQEVLQPKLDTINKEIENLRGKAEQINSNIEQLDNWKYLLYEQGEHHLQPIVRNALSIVGMQDKSDIEQIADGFFVCEYGGAILEVEGSKNAIKIEKINQLIKDRANYSTDKQITSPKGILVGNPFREEPLDNRPPKGSHKKLFTKELLQTAEKQDIVVILSTDLYNIASLSLRGQIPGERKREIRKLIFESTGLLKLP